MKKTNHFYRFCALALSCLLLISLLPVTQVLADGDGAIHIKSAEDLRSLAHSCTLDSWSRGKTVVLDNDIELTDDDELPIPTFGGTFNGNGHTISGLSITQSVSPAGLFGVLQKDAVITELNVEGTVSPSGDSESVGGIVGQAYYKVTVSHCYNRGAVTASVSKAGGIVGYMNDTGAKFSNCYTTGAVKGSNSAAVVGEKTSGNLSGCYYLDTLGTDSNAIAKTSDELKALAPTLGEPFMTDPADVNDGYPIFAWQVPTYAVTFHTGAAGASVTVIVGSGQADADG